MTPRVAQSALLNLVQSEALPTLGEIAYASTRDSQWNDPSQSRDDQIRHEALSQLWKEYDEAFQDRDDYRAWRILLRPFHPSALSISWGDPLELISRCLEHIEPVIVWGALSILPRIITGRFSRDHDPAQVILLAEKGDARISSHLAPIPDAEAGCSLIKALALDAILAARMYSHGSLTCDEVNLHFQRLKRYLKEVDDKWVLGRSISLRAVRQERKSGRVVTAFGDIKLLLNVTKALVNCRVAALAAIDEINVDVERLLRQAVIFASSAWRSTRALRRFEEDWRFHNQPRYTAIDIDRVRDQEMQALQNVSLAARDAGLYFLSAAMGHLFLRIVPDRLLTKAHIARSVNALLYTIKSAGFELDDRFHKPLVIERKQRVVADAEPIVEDAESAIAADSSLNNNPDNSTENSPAAVPLTEKPAAYKWRDSSRISKLRLARDLQVDPFWKQLVAICSPELSEPPSYLPLVLLTKLTKKARLLNNPEALRCTFNLSLKYGDIEGAAKLLIRFKATKQELLDFARCIKEALQIMPYGMNVNKHRRWQKLLKKAWNSLPEHDGALTAEVVLIHEVLLGRYLSIVRNSGPREAKLFTEKYYGLISPPEIKDTIENNISTTLPVITSISKRTFSTSVRRGRPGKLGSPVCVSLVSTGPESWSLLATEGSGRWVHKRIEISGIFQIAHDIQRTSKLWFRRVNTRGPMLGLPWGRELTRLADTITSTVEGLKPGCSWIMLAIEPDLATLPWQDLIRKRRESLLVSLIPSYSWALTARNRKSKFNQGMNQVLSPATDLSNMRVRIQRTKGMLANHLLSAAIVLGHGNWTQGSVTSVTAGYGQPLDLREWMKLADYRITVVHSCYGGRVEHKFLGDLGGLPGVFLGLNCRLLCAPVCEVSLITARTLHQHLFRADGPQEFGLRYLAAIAEDPAVALYNLYGFADEPLVQPIYAERGQATRRYKSRYLSNR